MGRINPYGEAIPDNSDDDRGVILIHTHTTTPAAQESTPQFVTWVAIIFGVLTSIGAGSQAGFWGFIGGLTFGGFIGAVIGSIIWHFRKIIIQGIIFFFMLIFIFQACNARDGDTASTENHEVLVHSTLTYQRGTAERLFIGSSHP